VCSWDDPHTIYSIAKHNGFVDSGIMGWHLVLWIQGPQLSADKLFSSKYFES